MHFTKLIFETTRANNCDKEAWGEFGFNFY